MSELPISIEIFGEIAAKKARKDGWCWYKWQRLDGGGHLFEGGVPTEFFSKGPRKGQPKWAGVEGQKFVVTDDEGKTEFLRREHETGKCQKCKGTGQQWSGWSVYEGVKTTPCTRCGATGNAP